jgi:hypothetical protein
MSSRHFVPHNVAHIDIDEELQGEVRRFIERVDRQLERWARSQRTATPTPNRSPLILTDIDDGENAQK